MKKNIYLAFIMIFCMSSFYSCKSETEKNKEQIAGIWEVKSPNIVKTMTLNIDGTFETQVVITEEESELIMNKGDIRGKWNLREKEFKLDIEFVTKTIEKDLGWKVNKPVVYTFDSVSLKKMKFLSKNKKYEWKRLVDPVTKEAIDSKDILIDLKPIAVNLYKDRIRGKERFLCLHYKLCFEDVDDIDYIISSTKKEFVHVFYELHPRVRDAVIMYLSSLTFKEVKTFAKSRKMNKQLKKILNHYLNNKLKTLEIDRIVVASSKDGVNDFMGFDDEVDEVEVE